MTGNLDAANRIANVEESALLSALAVNRKGMADGCFDAEAIQHRPEHFVVIESIDERIVHRHFLGDRAVHHALI